MSDNGNGSEALLSVKNLKTYFPTDEGLVKAVDGVSFDVMPGQTLGIVGESGCGKSTVGRSILGIIDKPGNVEDGEIIWRREVEGTVHDIDITKQPPNSGLMRSIRGSEIALVFQEPMTSLSPLHTVGDHIMEAMMLHSDLNKSVARDSVTEMLKVVGFPNPKNAIDTYPFELSGGLRQRAMIAMA